MTRFATKRKCLRTEFITWEGKKLLPNDFENVRREYQQLKLKYEEERNFKDAGDFHYGEMECLRKKSRGIKRFVPTLTTIYWASSGYGEKPIRAALNLFLLIFLWIYSLMFWGLQPTPTNKNKNDRNINYDPIEYRFSLNLTNSSAFVKDAINTFTYVTEMLIREEKGDRIYYPIFRQNCWFSGDGINAIGYILVSLQVVLFALAVRRRFQR